jgi:hypothetical protein
MFATHAFLLVVATVVFAAPPPSRRQLDRDDTALLASVHEQFADVGTEKFFENLFTLVHTLARHDAPFETRDFEHLLTADVRYVSHDRGECDGLAQVVGCLVVEQVTAETERKEAGSVEYQLSEVIQGGAQVVRLLEVRHPRVASARIERRLDVYFLHLRHDEVDGVARAWLIEHLPTVVAPLRLGMRT